MRKLQKVIASALIAASAAGVALPAQAQPYPQHGYDRYDDRYDHRYNNYDHRGHSQAIWRQIEELRERVERNDWRDRISEREAAFLRRDVYRLRQQFRDYSRNGLSHREARILQDRIRDVRQRLRYERHDRDGRRW